MNKDDIGVEVSERQMSSAKARKWFFTGEFLQLVVIIVAIVVSYVKQQAATDENRQALFQQAALITQLHESLDQLRMNRSMTPEAAQRIGVVEARLAIEEQRLARIENKLDIIIERQR